MAELRYLKKRTDWPELIGRCAVSSIFVLLSQCILFSIPQFFSDLPALFQLLLSALVLLAVAGLGGWCRRLLRVHASAPAFVFFNILFIWIVYVAVVRQAVSFMIDLLFNGQITLLIFGHWSILSSDPGFVSYGPSPSDVIFQSLVSENGTHHQRETENLTSSPYLRHSTEVDIGLGDRVRYCQSCKAFVKGFDHHCAAFGNCIGHKNLVLFMVLVIGFIWTEATYLVCLSHYADKYEVSAGTRLEISFSRNLAKSTLLFTILQLVWQAVFLSWHIYCICLNIRTDEWINWKRYPEFQLFNQSELGQSSSEMKFRNPYDRGVLQNVKEFMTLK